jgi:hypothetical protein
LLDSREITGTEQDLQELAPGGRDAIVRNVTVPPEYLLDRGDLEYLPK